MAIDRIGVGNIANLMNTTQLKSCALFFDKIKIMSFTFGCFGDVKDVWVRTGSSEKADCDFLIDQDFLSFFDVTQLYKENFGENFGDIERPGVFYLPPDAQQRYAASRLRDQGADAVCLGVSPVPRCCSSFLDRDRDSVDRIATKDRLYEIIIGGMPIPDENVPWQDILSFRAEQTSKELLRELRLWIAETANDELTRADAADRIEDLKEKYKATLKRARIRFALSVAEILVVGIAGNLIKLELKDLLDTPFGILDAREERLDMERKAPGRELRYLVHVEKSFPPR